MNLGIPSLALSGLQIWIHGRQFPDSNDYWDGNWLHVTAHYGATGADVWVTGSILHLRDLSNWLDSILKLQSTLSGEANLEPLEPELSVKLIALSLGHIRMKVLITPEHMTQKHEFLDQIDQSFLPNLIESLKSILTEYPIRSTPDR